MLYALSATTPPTLAMRYPPGLMEQVAAHPDRRVAHLVQPLGDGRYRVAGRVVDGLMAQSDSAVWPGIRFMTVQLWNPVKEEWSPRLTLAILDVSKWEHLQAHRDKVRAVPGWGKVQGLTVEVNGELAWRYQFYREGATAVRVLRGPWR